MADWKVLGYVPDSDDEDNEFGFPALSHAIDHKADVPSQPATYRLTSQQNLPTFPDVSPRNSSEATHKSTVEKLEDSLQRGLEITRDILTRSSPIGRNDEDNEDSPLSSPPSSLASSSPSLSQTLDQPGPDFLPLSADRQDDERGNDTSGYVVRRNLRVRNPIQLHPYMLEDAKYRTLMKARGLRPVQALQEATRPEHTEPGEDLQDTEALLHSQHDERQSFEISSSPLGHLALSGEQDSHASGTGTSLDANGLDLDDDLPDLQQLLHGKKSDRDIVYRRQRSGQIHKSAREWPGHGVTQYIAKSALEESSILPHQRGFSVPPSPPRSNSSQTNEHDRVFGDEILLPELTTPTALPTPLISSDYASRKRNRLVLSSSDEFSEEEVHSDSSSPENEMVESQGMQQMSRKIRGVLPASWLKLDMRKQTRVELSQRPYNSSLANAADRGIARRTTSSIGPRSKVKQDYDRQILSSGDEESDTNDPSNLRSPSMPGAIGTRFDDDSLMEEVVEDNSIDAMFPPSRSRRTKKTTSGKRQSRLNQGWVSSSLRDEMGMAFNGEDRDKQVVVREARPRQGSRLKKLRRRSSKNPHVSILEAPGLDIPRGQQPKFLRIAARRAKKSTQHSGVSASKKVFRLASRRETEEVNQVLNNWTLNRSQGTRPSSKLAQAARKISGTRNVDQGTIQATTGKLQPDNSSHFKTELTALKQSTGALLKRIRQNPESLSRNVNEHSPTTESAMPTGTSTSHQRFYYPLHNRSGSGRLWSGLATLRQAQVEIEKGALHQQGLLNGSPYSNRAPVNGKVRVSVREHLNPDTTADMSHYKAASPSTKSRSQRKPKKQTPKRFEHRETEWQEQATVTTYADTTTHEDKRGGLRRPESESTFLPDELTDNYSKICMRLLVDTSPFSQEVEFQNRTIEQGILAKVMLVFEKNKAANMHSRLQTTDLFMSEDNATEAVMSHAGHCEDFLSKWHDSILYNLDSWDYMDTRPLVDLEQCIEKLNTEAHWSSFQAANSSVLDSQQYFVTSCGAFLRRAKEYLRYEHGVSLSTQRSQHCLAIRTTNLLIIHAFQIWTATLGFRNDHVKGQAKDSCLSIIRFVLSQILKTPNFIHHVLARIDERYNPDFHGICVAFDDCFPEAESALIAWHIIQAMSKVDTSVNFFQLIASAVNRDEDISVLMTVPRLLLAVRFIIPFTLLDPKGDRVVEHTKTDHAGWSLLAPQVQKLFKYFKTAQEKRCTTVYRRWTRTIILFFHSLIDVWRWPPTPQVVKTFLEAYSYNNMLAVNYNDDDNQIFFNLDTIDYVPHSKKTDFDLFVDVVERVVTFRQRVEDDGDEMMPELTASKMRGFVYSLIPNNAQLYHACEDLGADQFLGLKNHFALYIALFRSAPDGVRPRLQQLQQQVDLELSHLAVCRLAVCAWKVVARHIVEQSSFGSETTAELSEWLRAMYKQALSRLSSGHDDAKAIIEDLLHALEVSLLICPTEGQARQLLNPMLDNLKLLLPPFGDHGNAIFEATLAVFEAYARSVTGPADYETSLTSSLLPLMKEVMCHALHHNTWRTALFTCVVSTWFSIARSAVSSSIKTWDNFLEPQSSFSIDFLAVQDAEDKCNIAKAIFVTKLLETKGSAAFSDHCLLLLRTWVVSLLSPVLSGHQLLQTLTHRVLEHGASILRLKDICKFKCDWEVYFGGTHKVRFAILRHIIQVTFSTQGNTSAGMMSRRSSDQYGGEDEDDLSANDTRNLLQTMLHTMRATWLSLGADPVAQNEYTTLVTAVVSEMETYPYKGIKIDRWFTDNVQFPRPSQTLDNMFRCRFGLEGSKLAKAAITTFRFKSTEALKFQKQDALAAEIERVFTCDDVSRVQYVDGSPLYSIDIRRQMQFLRLVFPVYIEQTDSRMGALIALPILKGLCSVVERAFFRIDSGSSERMLELMHASIGCLVATESALRAEKVLSSATPLLLEYARLATDMVWTLQQQQEIDIPEPLHATLAATILGIAELAFARLPDTEQEEDTMIGFAVRCSFVSGHIEKADKWSLVGNDERDLREYAYNDLRDGLALLEQGSDVIVPLDHQDIARRARKFLELVAQLPLLPEDEDDDDEDEDFLRSGFTSSYLSD